MMGGWWPTSAVSPSTPDRRRDAACARLILLVAGLGLAASACGPPPVTLTDPARNRLPLEAWVSVTQDTTGAVRPGVSVAVPYRSLIFRNDERGLVSVLRVQAVALRDGRQVGGGVAAATARVAGTGEAASGRELRLMAPLQVRGTAPVELEVHARVVGTERVWLRRLQFAPGSLAAMPVWIEDVKTDLAVGDEAGARVLPPDAERLALAVRLRRQRGGPDWPPSGIDLVTEVSAASLDAPRQRRSAVAPLADADTLNLEQVWPVTRLPFGRLRIGVALEARRDQEVVRLPREPALEVVNLAVPVADDRTWRRHLQWLDGVIAAAARDSLRDLAAAERPTAWQAVWRAVGAARELAPAAAERQHLLRIVAADDRFSAFGRGALSDRGRVYIRWGEPARVETFADPHTPGAVWEIWIYPERGRRVLFHDAHGFGDFRLRREEPILG